MTHFACSWHACSLNATHHSVQSWSHILLCQGKRCWPQTLKFSLNSVSSTWQILGFSRTANLFTSKANDVRSSEFGAAFEERHGPHRRAEMLDVTRLKGHAAQKFLEQCQIECKGPSRCKSTGRRFRRVRLCQSDKHQKRPGYNASQFVSLILAIMQEEARVIIEVGEKKEALSLEKAHELLAPLFKQGRDRKSSALKLQV